MGRLIEGIDMYIEKTTPDGIYYTNDVGEKIFIDFKLCNENWLAYRKRTETLSDEQIAHLRGKDKIVGRRKADAKPAFIEFFTRPFTRLEFHFPEKENEFNLISNNIRLNGWITLDLS